MIDFFGLKIVMEISIFEILSLLGIVFAIISLHGSFRSSKEQAKIQRAEFSFRVWQNFMSDEVQEAYLSIEWDRFEYPCETSTGFKSNDEEAKIDKLLYLLDEVAILIEAGVLMGEDKDRWSYQGLRVFTNDGIIKYLNFLDEFFQANKVGWVPHAPARRVFGPANI